MCERERCREKKVWVWAGGVTGGINGVGHPSRWWLWCWYLSSLCTHPVRCLTTAGRRGGGETEGLTNLLAGYTCHMLTGAGLNAVVNTAIRAANA